MRRWSLAGQMLVLQLVVLAVTVTGGAALVSVLAQQVVITEAAAKSKAVDLSVASLPRELAALSEPSPTRRLQPYAERVRAETRVDFVTIMKPDGTRYTHPNPAEIGRGFLGRIDRAVRGEAFTETYTGTLGPSVRAV